MSTSVFIRADLNVPMHHTSIVSDYKLHLCAETYHAVASDFSRIIIATHQGRPTGSSSDPTTHAHTQWFIQHGIPARYIDLDELIAQQPSHGTFVLPNLRSYPGEQSDNTQVRKAFAHTLRATADAYLFDALAVAHRSDTSVALLPCLYPQAARLISQHTKDLLRLLHQFKTTPEKRLVILGGTKASTKLAYIPYLLKQGTHVAVCPPLSLAFQPLHAQSLAVSIPSTWSTAAQALQVKHPHLLKRLILPQDYVITAPVHTTKGEIPFISPGAISMHQIMQAMMEAKAILYNGLMGSMSYPETLSAIQIIFQSMAQASAQPCIIAGGDSVAAALRYNPTHSGLVFSAAGGAALAYIADQPLPAFTCLSIKR